MNNLKLENFKAFRKPLELSSPSDESVLIYGENGSGKSSLYDAFRLFYFRDKIFRDRIAANVIEDREDEETAIVTSFRFDKTNNPMILSIDGTDFSYNNAADNLQVFLLSYSDLHPQKESEDYINIVEIVRKSYFKHEDGLEGWCDSVAEQEIVSNTNKVLKEMFYMNDIELVASQTGDDACTLERKGHVSKKKGYLSRYFNEATLHLIRFIILMECINFIRNKQKHALLVLDDCFNSLDAPNRTFMMRYLIKETKGMQKIVLTHNLSYYNLMGHILNTEYKDENWLRYILVQVNGDYELREEDAPSCISDIIEKYQNGYYTNSSQLGNAIRQEFEVLVYRLCMLCNIGAKEECHHLLDLLCSPNRSIYFTADNEYNVKTATKLVDEIYSNVTNGNHYNLQKRLKEKIDNFRANDILSPLIPALVELRLLQKVALHQASHGHIGQPPIQSKEFDVSIALLKKIEEAIKSIKTINLSTI